MTNQNNTALRDIALLAPNLWGQVYLLCRGTHGIDHEYSMALADDAMRAFGEDRCETHDDLDFVIVEIARVD
ncbi:hypothetical protein [Achromobacter sp. 413638]|jgi:hypothetical protein|uniref:hypothetical protein n=1 Tax=Achromobacter sp. 413638 TaxID=3342385 RepID=UPI00370CE210